MKYLDYVPITIDGDYHFDPWRISATRWCLYDVFEHGSDDHWNLPREWNKEAKGRSVRPRVVCSMSCDVFQGPEGVSAMAWEELIRARVRLFDLIQRCSDLDWELVTWRPENVKKCVHLAKQMSEKLPDETLRWWLNDWRLGDTPENISITVIPSMKWDDPPLVPLSAIAETLGKPLGTVRSAADRGCFPFEISDKKRVADINDVVAYFQTAKVGKRAKK